MRVYIVIFDDGEMDSELRIVKVFDSWKKADAFLSEPQISVREHRITNDDSDWVTYDVMIAEVLYASFYRREQAEGAAATLKERSEEFFHLREWDVD